MELAFSIAVDDILLHTVGAGRRHECGTEKSREDGSLDRLGEPGHQWPVSPAPLSGWLGPQRRIPDGIQSGTPARRRNQVRAGGYVAPRSAARAMGRGGNALPSSPGPP